MPARRVQGKAPDRVEVEPAGTALDVETAAEQSHSFCHPHKSEPATFRGTNQRVRDLEPPAVVFDLNLGAPDASLNSNLHLVCAAVLANVCEALLHDPVEGNPLGRGHGIHIAAQVEPRLCLRAALERLHLTL